MRLFIGVFVVATFTSCATTEGWQDGVRFKEPLRTRFMEACAAQLPATHCLCAEHGMVQYFGTIEKALEGDDEVIKGIHKACEKKLMPTLQKEFEEYQMKQTEKYKI